MRAWCGSVIFSRWPWDWAPASGSGTCSFINVATNTWAQLRSRLSWPLLQSSHGPETQSRLLHCASDEKHSLQTGEQSATAQQRGVLTQLLRVPLIWNQGNSFQNAQNRKELRKGPSCLILPSEGPPGNGIQVSLTSLPQPHNGAEIPSPEAEKRS